MIRRFAVLAALAAVLAAPAAAQADFGIVPGSTSITSLNRDGTVDTQAGSHPYSVTVHFELNTDENGEVEGGQARDGEVVLPPGMIGNPTAVPRCPQKEFEGGVPSCSPNTQVGVLHAIVPGIGEAKGAIFNVVPPHGIAAELGFVSGSSGLVVLQYATLRTDAGYAVGVISPNLPTEASSVTETIWGTPADHGHDAQRGAENAEGTGLKPIASDAPLKPFLTLPTSCGSPPTATLRLDSILAPGAFVEETVPAAVDAAGHSVSMSGCEAVPFSPTIASRPTSLLAENASGLDFELDLPNQGLVEQESLAETEPEKVEVTLPEGMTLNPSAAEGLAVCSQARYEAEQVETKPGEGCPEASKIGSLLIHTPLLEEPIEGALYLAAPYENPAGTLLAVYLVARSLERGVIVKQVGRVEPDPKTGQLVTTFEGLPPQPYSDVRLHFREGGRAPLTSPPACGEYETTAKLYPFSAPDQPRTVADSFQIEKGVDGGACPSGGLPFRPGFEAGSVNAAAGAYSPFVMRLTRRDGDQDLTKFSATLPPGVIGRLAGTAQCSDADIALARSRTGPHGGAEEIAAPSCPASSRIGRVLAGAGVGGVLTHVPGKLYLAGPLNGAPLSVVAIVPAVAGPFDVGTVVTREALRINPLTAEVTADGSASDPIPHILRGIPLKVREIRAYVDRPDFTLNPTSCTPSSTEGILWSGGANVFSALDDSPFALSARFQAANCASLGFKPRLKLSLKGGTRRGGHPALTGTYKPRPGDANTKSLVLTLPHSAFLEQAHIRTICTRVQFAADGGGGRGCPAGAIYGKAKAYTPLLDDPLEGNVYLRSSNHNLPDFVAALHGLVDVEAVARIDSKNGGIRSSFAHIPDAPISKVVVQMQGGKKGLIINSTDICAGSHQADAHFAGHNGKSAKRRPEVRASCGGRSKKR